MKIHTVSGVKGNFGDALNEWMWPRLAPELFDDDESTLFVGIGTIFDDHLPKADLRVVFGAGAGYGQLPVGRGRDSGWAVYGVRGKLTARVLDLPEGTAATDPAILLCTFPELRAEKVGDVIFVPHWKTTRYGCWDKVCRACNVKLVDPCQDPVLVVREIASARKVIAESMHAAIVADAFRVPWVPVTASREVSAFKWRDWGSSLDLPYRPRCLPPSLPVEALRDRVLAIYSAGCISNYPNLDQQRAGAVLDFPNDDEVVSDFLSKFGGTTRKRGGSHHKVMEIVLKRVSLLERKLGILYSPITHRWFHDACRAMLQAKEDGGYLSGESKHDAALTDTRERWHCVRREWEHPFIDRSRSGVLAKIPTRSRAA
jgi:hypothetical protein